MAPPLTRAAVIEAARSLIATDGLEAVSLRRLAGILGVTAPALYAHVTDKQDLLRGVAELEFAQLIDAFRGLEATDPIARLRAQSRIYIERALAEPALFRTMFLFPPEL
ncbi:MAG TPA: TetR family transcriptional regulator, partial [Acidimicrobiales bacterium]